MANFLKQACEGLLVDWESKAQQWDVIDDDPTAPGCAWGRRACVEDLKRIIQLFGDDNG